MGQSRYMQLDPIKDHETIVKWMVVDTWKFDLLGAYEIAFLKLLASPEIAETFVGSYGFIGQSTKRYDDVSLLLSVFMENGYSSPKGMKAIQKIKSILAVHAIPDQQMLYALAILVAEPIHWIETFGWRPLTTVEREALFHFWIEVGRRVSIKNLPRRLDDMLAHHELYEAEKMVYSEYNARLYQEMAPYLTKNWPFPLKSMKLWLFSAIMTPRMCAAFALKPKADIWRSLLQNLLKIRGQGSQLLPSRPHFRSQKRRPSYSKGLKIDQFDFEVAEQTAEHRLSER